MLLLHPCPHLKWHHSRLCSKYVRMSHFCVCFQIVCTQSLTPDTYTSLLYQTAPEYYVSLTLEGIEVSSNFDYNYATGQDRISVCVLKTCSAALAHPALLC